MSLSLRVNIVDSNVTKTIVFIPSTTVHDACRIIREKCTEAIGQPQEYGLFLTDEDNTTGVWLEPARNLEYYILKNGDTICYRKKMRILKVAMLDGTVKTMLVDDSQIVANLMVVICAKLGITNHDEYSLVLEDLDSQENNIENKNYSTLTLKRKKEERAERDAKMEQLRRKLHTDDEVHWLDPSKTLREQGIDEYTTVLLRRKFFFSDQNIDSRDPVQLNLLYVQARDAIVNGTHPITQDKACEFAGIQCQIQFGDYNETKHKPGFLDLKELLPQSYMKMKGIEKKVFQEHKKCLGMNELDAKVKYTKTARSLPTYGVTFFLVKEKMKGKNKLVPRLLGVTKDSVLRLDEKTKETMQTWPLTTVRRWGASPNTFTLDFGDYSDQYYSVQTTEAEQIQQIIAGYIDIILKKKQAKDHFGIHGDEGSTMFEESVAPHKASIIQHESNNLGKMDVHSISKPAVIRNADSGRGDRSYRETKIHSLMSDPQRALVSTIEATQVKIKESELELDRKAHYPEIGSDAGAKKWKQVTLDTSKQNVGSQIAAMNAATAQVVTLTMAPDEVDHHAVGAAITTIGSNLPEMTKEVKKIIAFTDDSNMGDKLLDATRHLCKAFSDLLKAAEPESKEPRQSLLNAASRVGEASTQVLATIGEDTAENKELQDLLLALAKAVANTTAALVLKAKNIAASCDDQPTQNRVIGAATQCALATSQLVACAKVVAPTIQSPACQEQLTAAVREVAKAVENLVGICNEATPDEDLNSKLNEAAAEVTRSLNDLLNHIKFGPREKAKESVQEQSVEEIYTATDKISAATGDANEMVRQARRLGNATAQLIQSIKGEAESQPANTDIHRRLLAAAKTLADATARMVEAARQCTEYPHDIKRQDQLRRTAEDLRDVTIVAATTPALRAKLIDRVQACARKAISSATQCISAAQASHEYNSNAATREALIQDTRELAEQIPPLVESIKHNGANPDDTNAQSELMYVAEVFLHPATHFVQTSRTVLPTLIDQSITEQLSLTSHQLNSDLSDLRNAISRAKPTLQGLGLDGPAQLIDDLQEELREFERAVEEHRLRPLPGDSAEKGAQQLIASSKMVNQGVAQLLSATAQGNEMYNSQAARDTAHSLSNFTGAVRCIAATSDNPDLKRKIIHSGQDVLTHSAKLLEESYQSLYTVDTTPTLQRTAKNVQAALQRTIGCLPGQRDVDAAITNIIEWTSSINSGEFPSTNKSYGELQQELTTAAANLDQASAGVVHSVDNPIQLASSSKDFSSAFYDLLRVSMEMAGETTEPDIRTEMVQSLKTVSTSSSALLTTAKSLSADPTLPNGKNQLAAAARAVTDSINHLVNVCTSNAPGQTECDNAIRKIQAMRYLLEKPSEPVNDCSYFESLDCVIEKSKVLGEALTGMTNTARHSEHEKFSDHIKSFSSAICSLVETSAQTAYLVGASDSSSIAGRPGLVDQAQFARASQAIKKGCEALTMGASPQKQVLEAATTIAKHTSALCNSCRVASSKTTNPVAKRQFVQSAKAVANSTSALVKEIKALDADYSELNRRRCAEATRPLLDAVEDLCVYASSSEFVTIPAKISPQAREAQKPIVGAGNRLIDSSCSVISSAKNLIVMPKDPSTWQQFAKCSKDVSDSMKELVANIRSSAPGGNECEQAAQILTNHLKTLDAAYMDAVSQSLQPRRTATLPIFSQQVERAAAGLTDTIEPLRHAAKFEAENIGHTVNQMIQYFEPLVQSTIGAASNMTNSKQQEQLLNQAKSVTESALQFVYSSKDCGGNPQAKNIHQDIDETADLTKVAIQDLVQSLEIISTQSGIVSGVVDNLTRAITRLSDHRASLIISDSDNYVDYQTRMVECAKEVAKISGEMATKAATDSQQLAALSAQLSHKYTQLANDSIGAAAAATNGEVGMRLKEVVQQLGSACVDLVQASGQCLISKDDINLREVGECSRIVAEKVATVLATLQSGSRGTQACINAASTVSGIIGDLETTIMFATAGNLNPENENESFADHRENILKTAKALVEDTKTLVAGAASSQEQLAVAAQNSVATIVQLAEVVKLGAASLGSDNPDSQVMLINAVRDVASALGDLIHATKAASGKPINDPAMAHLKDSAKIMVTNVTSLLKTVKAVEDEHTRGTRALESTVEAIGQEMRSIYSSEGIRQNVTVEDLIRCTKSITNATAKSVSAGISNKQDDIIAAANLSRKAISDMLITCKSAAFTLAETEELRRETLNAGHECAKDFRQLLITILEGNGSADMKQTLPIISRKIAQSVTELVSLAKRLKGSDWVDPDDPTVKAEHELLGAAASIDAAAKKLANLRPRQNVTTQDPNLEFMNFDEMILEAAKSITSAIGLLIKAASAAQRELIDSGKMSRYPISSSDDGQWSEGLISAARLVAAATHSLVEAANALVQGLGSEDKLIAAAKQVASSTAHLLVACKVKAEGDTEATRRLHAAGNAVIRSTDNLVRAAQQAEQAEEERYLVINRRMVGGIAQEIDAQTEVCRIERELLEAKNKLVAIRKEKYKLKRNETSGDETDGYISSAPEQETRYGHSYDNSRSPYNQSTNQYYQDSTYDHLESPDKINSLDRQTKSLLGAVNQLDQAVYGSSNSYGQSSPYAATYDTPYAQQYPVGGYSSSGYDSYNQARGSPTKPASPVYKTTPGYGSTVSCFQPSGLSTPSHYATLNPPSSKASMNTSPKPFSSAGSAPPPPPPPTYLQTDYQSSSPSYQQNEAHKSQGFSSIQSHTFKPSSTNFEKTTSESTTRTFKPSVVTTDISSHSFKPLNLPNLSSDGYSTSEYSTNTYKTPEGYRTDSYKYEYYKSEPKTTFSSNTEKYYTTTTVKGGDKGTIMGQPSPKSAFDSFKNNGGRADEQYQSSYSSNVEYITEPPVVKDDLIEQKTIKKSINEERFEKRTTTTSRTTKQESQMKTFKFQ
ncbi:talin-1 isoform X3 [Euwallacea fornicatus]|uniref:talin-1 isoform X3 n=1 Tax=Euwallacea fornicatus TaxID=995702 RepID=UPI00338E5575